MNKKKCNHKGYENKLFCKKCGQKMEGATFGFDIKIGTAYGK
jgi:hypothetical protein